jgi:toxin-antitoxin system PIN domain toxin
MNLPDVNVLVYAFRRDSERHAEYRAWLLDLLNADSAFGLSEQVLAGVIRISTHSRIFEGPSTLAEASRFTETLRDHPRCRIVRPSPSHWPLFLRLCQQAGARGNLVTDAWFAALAIESGCTWISSDRDYARFPGLRWRHPLDHEADIENPS